MRTLAEALLYVAAAFTGGVICSGCVTTSDLRELAAELEKTYLEVADLVTTTADLLEVRTEATLTGLNQAAEGGLLGLLGAAAGADGVHRRRKRQESTPSV